MYKRQSTYSEGDLHYLEKLQEYCSRLGFIRHEVRFAERYLNQKGLKPWHTTHADIKAHYKKELSKMTERCEISMSANDLKGAVKSTYYDYLNGINVKARMTKPTFYRHRKAILGLGVDIAEATTVRALQVKPKVVEVKAAEIPLFYNRVHPKIVASGAGNSGARLYKRADLTVL